MSKIHVLDEHLTNMIAAGEVVEKPSGVVKELVENSIDANARMITVKVYNGGKDAIEVIDDGVGMDQQDAIRAFSRHATSKIARPDDLWDIHTMGFRGEALPSIASVAKVILTTNDGNESTGVQIEYGKIVKAGPEPCANGTSIRVEGLFYRTPARLKHLKSGSVEINAIVEIMQKFALSHPEIAFELYSDDKQRLSTSGSGSLEEAVLNIYGLEIARNSLPISLSDYDFQVEGVIVLPSLSRSGKQYINCFINGRMVRSFLIQKAVCDAYRGFMMPERFPIVVLNIKADYQLVDVNVHPSKWEIRLSKERQLCSLLENGIREILTSKFTPGEIHLPKEKIHVEEQTMFTTTYSPEPEIPVNELKEEPETYLEEKPVKPQRIEKVEPVVVDRFQYLAQLHGNYILAYDEESLFIIDQHAAMERCQYEDILKQMANNEIITQPLLIPLVVELTPAQKQQLDKLNETFKTIGMELEEFSGNSVLIRQVPIWLEEDDEQQFVHDLVEAIMEDKKMNSLDVRNDRIATMACHSSIRFNHKLEVAEAKTLLHRLSQCRQPFNCPHGRPTMMTISEKQLQKEFKRV